LILRSSTSVTSIYLQGIDNAEIIETVHARRANDPRQGIPATLSDTASPTAALPAMKLLS
jgi:hypothetical protein